MEQAVSTAAAATVASLFTIFLPCQPVLVFWGIIYRARASTTSTNVSSRASYDLADIPIKGRQPSYTHSRFRRIGLIMPFIGSSVR
jgi:hypothetical protein